MTADANNYPGGLPPSEAPETLAPLFSSGPPSGRGSQPSGVLPRSAHPEPEARLLREAFTLEGAAIDEEASVIRGVVVLSGRQSRNGHRYTPEALGQLAALIGAGGHKPRSFIDHNRRSYRDLLGRFANGRVDERRRVVADLELVGHAENVRLLLAQARRAPELAGFSIVAEATFVRDPAGALQVVDIRRLHSIDLVPEPAATAGLFEQTLPVNETPARKTGLVHPKEGIAMDKEAEDLKEVRPDYRPSGGDEPRLPAARQASSPARDALSVEVVDPAARPGRGQMGQLLREGLVEPLRGCLRRLGRATFLERFTESLRSGEIALREVSLRLLFEALVGAPDQWTRPGVTPGLAGWGTLQEAINTSGFEVLAQSVIQQAVREGYQTTGFIGDELVTILQSPYEEEKIGQPESPGAAKTVQEGEPYPETGFGEKWVQTAATKHGRILWLTREVVMRDRTGVILRQAAALGRFIGYSRELAILGAVQDLSTHRSYYPKGQQKPLYRAAAGSDPEYEYAVNKKASNVLTDWTSLDAARQLLAEMTDREGNKILVSPDRILLVPEALATRAAMIAKSVEVELGGGAGASGSDVTRAPNPFRGLRVLYTPLLADGTTWYYGDFKTQFVWHEVWPLSVERAPANHPRRFDADIITGFKASYYGGCRATDDKYVIQCAA